GLPALGLPDFTGGFYVPIRLRARAGSDQVTAVYRLRYHLPALPIPKNRNPSLAGVFVVKDGLPADGGAPLDASPPADGGGGADLSMAGCPPAADTTPLEDRPVTLVPLVEDTPLAIHRNETIVLRALFSDGSAETYPVLGGDPGTANVCLVTEVLSVSWY